ncbi:MULTISPECIES: GerW family sporulation protein [Oceanobacillus]|uniref:Spore protein YtfJ n=1 Tax=Oceanobacillus indicireducens TaxID=1004261 RepID=A0A918CY55_9BACI|nr:MULTISPECIES: GerW family sporulation protein [Oceanobacillus]GGN48791.1 putative spore protein YtfJ [Oceanobacillus indicireducens]
MEEHPIQGLMTTAMESLQSLVETNTIIGDSIETPDGSTIIPVSKVGFGFAAGGSEFSPQSTEGDATLPFGGGSGGGVSLTPIAFLVVKNDEIKMVRLDQHTQLYEKFLEMTPQVIDKVEKIMKDKGSKKDKKEKVKKTNPLNFDI